VLECGGGGMENTHCEALFINLVLALSLFLSLFTIVDHCYFWSMVLVFILFERGMLNHGTLFQLRKLVSVEGMYGECGSGLLLGERG
jgi:hypothetical protein